MGHFDEVIDDGAMDGVQVISQLNNNQSFVTSSHTSKLKDDVILAKDDQVKNRGYCIVQKRDIGKSGQNILGSLNI